MAIVKAPVRAPPLVPPTRERTPLFVIVTAPVAPLTPIPVPAIFDVTPVLESVTVPPKDTGEPLTPNPVPPVTVIVELASSALVTTEEERTPLVLCTTPVGRPNTLTFPVVAPPRVSVCLAVVDSVPSDVIYVPPLRPELTDAVGVPLLTFNTANLAEEEDCPPRRKSTVLFLG